MKIRPCYLKLIRDGIKRHEYRLNAKKYEDCHIGDTILLVSDCDINDYIEKEVKDIKVFSNWKEALANYWQEDFRGLYSTFDEVVFECLKFYPIEEVNKLGIKVFYFK